MAIKIRYSLIRDTLDQKFPGHILSRAYQYFQQGRVLEVEEEEQGFRARVRGAQDQEYLVRGSLSYRKELLLNCSCPHNGHCKHQAAVLYQLREDRTVPRSRAGSTAAAEALAPGLQLQLSGGKSSGSYRQLPLQEASLDLILRKLGASTSHFNPGAASFEGELRPDGSLHLRQELHFSYRPSAQNAVVLQKKGKDLLIKCESCDQRSYKLCTHQTLLLTLAAETLEDTGFLHPDFSLDGLLAQMAEDIGVAPAAFHKYYELHFSPLGFEARPKKENVFTQQWMAKAKKTRRSSQAERQHKKKQLERELAAGQHDKAAFLWTIGSGSGEDPPALRFMQGASLKTKDGIRSTDREITELPEGFASPQLELARQLYFYCQEAPRRHFEAIKSLIEEHIDSLNSVYQYVATSSSLRASDLFLVTFHPRPLEAKFRFERVDGLLRIVREVTVDGQPFPYHKVLFSNGIFCATPTQAYLFPHAEFERFMDLFPGEDHIYLPAGEGEGLTEIIEDFKQHFDTEVEEGLSLPEQTLTDPTFQILLSEMGDYIIFEPQLSYGTYTANAFEENAFFIDEQLHRVEESDRQFLVDFIKNAHPDFVHQRQVRDFVFLPVSKMLDNYWFLHFNEACEAAGIVLLGQKELSKFNYSKHKANTFSQISSGIDWFEVEMGLSFGDEEVKTADWIRALRNKESFVRLSDGTLGILPEEWLKKARQILSVAEYEKGKLKISKYRFNIIEELFEELDDQEILLELAQKKRRLAELETDKEYPLPDRLQADLRPYQKHGFAWLKFLEESGFGGILADDMGLGKTLQVLALLADQYNQAPSLIIVPRSLLFNWGAEIEKFCPDLTYTIHHGPTRARRIDELLASELIITTYGTATSDVQLLKDFTFNYIVLDESQAIKNPTSKRYKAMRLLRSQHRIAMTGTPIENNTFDLYAQLSFCSPGLLGTQTSFRKNFAVPIDAERNQEAAELLRKLIRPFVLRRTKEQVAQELPDKTETVIYCEMGNTQRRLYENLKRKIKEDIEAEMKEKGFARSKFKMLDGLLRLRQMCNSPLLLNQSFKEQHAQSVKIDVLLEQLTEELDQHSALVFSQFVSFLSLVRRELDKRGIPYAYLDGSTTRRKEEVEKFMENKQVRIFLISLKAGNTGLNLTKADYVYLLDPWWNPAVESQAIDRTHRIGQDKNIFAYKLICKDSIEEKILKLQERKKAISTDIIRTDEHAFKSLDKEELMELFA